MLSPEDRELLVQFCDWYRDKYGETEDSELYSNDEVVVEFILEFEASTG